jgi:two-component sensor histidine kinase
VLAAVGVIVTELITNAMKHVLRHTESGVIHISATQTNGIAQLTVPSPGSGTA